MEDLEDHSDGDPTMPTTKDLARAAGVSRATVDRVLNRRPGVKEKTIKKVNDAARSLGFARNISAANLAKGRTYRFQFLLPRSGDQFLARIRDCIEEAAGVFAADRIRADVRHIEENDPHAIAAYLSTLSADRLDGIAIMAPETPPLRDAMARLEERGVSTLPFIATQGKSETAGVAIDNRAAGRTAATLLGRFSKADRGRVLVVSETMLSRDSIARRQGFDEVLGARFPHLSALASVETYGLEARAREVIRTAIDRTPDIVGVYILSAEARVPLSILRSAPLPPSVVRIAHERTSSTETALRDGTLDAIIAQDAGHLVRSAIRRLRALSDGSGTLASQERIRTEILIATNL